MDAVFKRSMPVDDESPKAQYFGRGLLLPQFRAGRWLESGYDLCFDAVLIFRAARTPYRKRAAIWTPVQAVRDSGQTSDCLNNGVGT